MHIRSGMLSGLTIMGVALLLGACGGGKSSTGSRPVLNAALPAVEADVDSGAKPNPDGFAFPNFGAAATSVEFGGSDMSEMFSANSEICVSQRDIPKGLCELSAEARAWARMVNQARVSGHCEGLAVLASSRFINKEEPKTITLTQEEDLTHAIMRAFATQFLDETQEATKTWAKKRPSEIVAALVDSLKQGATSFTLGVYTDSGGHAVLPYAVEFPSREVARIMVYDSNWPGMDRYVEVNLTDETWQFSFSGVDPAVDPQLWKGGAGDIDITPLDARVNGTCPFCESTTGVQKSLLLIRSAKPDWTIQSTDGELTPGSQLVGESVVRPLRSALPPRPVVADASPQGPTDYLVFTNLSGKGVSLRLGSTTRVVGVTPKAIFEIDAQSDFLSVDVTISNEQVAVDDPKVGLTLSNENFVASSAGDENTISLGDNGIAVDLVNEDGSAIRFETSESARAIDVRTGAASDATPGAKYEVFTQVSDSQVEHLVVAEDGAKTTTRQQGQLENQKTSAELPEQLEAPIVKAGLPPSEVREFTGTPEVSGAVVETTTTIAATTTTTTSPAITTTTTTIPLAPTQAPSEDAVLALPLVEPGKTLQASSAISPGGEVSVRYSGLAPRQWTQLIVASTPQIIDTALTDDSGSVSLSGKLPATLTPGNHHLVIFQPQSKTGVRQLVTYTVPVTTPGSPTAIAAAAGNAQATVSWVAPTSNGGAPISSYLVTASPGVHSCTSVSQSGAAPPLSCTVVGLTNGRSYTFTVSATNSAGTSTDSSASASVVPVTTPSAPMSVVGVSGDSRVTLSWTAPLQSGGTAITDYTVLYSAFSTGPFIAFQDSVSTSTSAVVPGLVNGSTYFFKITAVNAVGEGEASAITNGVTPAAVPGPPTSVVATRGNGEANISWAAPSANGASITRYTATSTPGGFTCLWTSGPLTCDVQGLTNGTSYTFVVTATNSVGEGNPSAASQAIIPVAVPSEPTSVAGSSGNGVVSLTWTAPTSVGGSGIIDYVIEYSSNAGSSWSVYADGTSTTTSATVSGLTNGTSYLFRISALNSVGIGQVSLPSSSVVPATVPGAPTSVSGVSGGGQVSVSWVAPVSNGGASVSSYVVTASPGGQTCSWSGGALSCVVSGLSNGVEYTFSVVAGNSAGVGLSSSASSAVTPLGSAPVLGSFSTANGQITFSWGGVAHGGDTYRVYWGTDPTWQSAYSYTSSGSATSYTATGLTNGTTYYFRVAGWNNNATPQVGTTLWSANGSAVPATVPGAPASVSGTKGDGSVTISWVAPAANGSPITDYEISVGTSSTGPFTLFTDAVSTVPGVTVNGLTNATSYYFKVAAVSLAGTGATSTASAAITPASPCTSACAIGDVGPAGGIIFMTPSTPGNTTGKYFEAAPTGWSGTGIDRNIAWCNATSTLIGTPTALGTAIGTGSANTDAIVTVCTTGAAKSARAYSGGGVSDWFLPSIDELTEMYANRASIGGFVQTTQVGTGLSTTTYWSSSEYNNFQSKNWSFLTNGNDNWGKNYGFGVRPIRSFATPSAPTIGVVTASNASLSVAFTAGSSGGYAITSYKYSTDGGSTFRIRASGTTASPLVISTLSSDGITALSNGTSYDIQIKAVNAIGDGTATSSTSATPRLPASALAMTTQPVGAPSGAPLSTQPVVRVLDSVGNTVTTSTASVTVTASGGTLGGTTTVAAVNGVATFTNVTHTTAGIYTLTFAVSGLTSVTSANFTTDVDTCAAGGTCYVGNAGPGGGKVFYVSSSNFTSAGSACSTACQYLEAAPTGWITSSTPVGQTNCTTPGTSTADPGCEWSGNTSTAVGSTASAIGTGYANTTAIIAQSSGGNTAGKAATVARAYQGGGHIDWYLPSLAEVNELCKYARNQTTGTTATTCTSAGSVRSGFTSGGFYWSSTEVNSVDALYRNFGNGGYAGRGKDQGWLLVRPVRAFSKASAVVVSTQPVGASSEAALATQPVVRIVDAAGNTVTHSSASVTVTASGGTLGGTTTITAVNGVATFTNLTHTTGGTYTLTFASTSPSTLTSVTSSSFTTAPQFNNGHVVFSWVDSSIYQQVVVSDMATTASQTISFKARNAAQGPDLLSVFVNLYNSAGSVLAARVECPHAPLTDSYQTFSCAITPASVSGTLQGGLTWSDIGRITVEVNGRDKESWGGNYGTVVDYVSLVATKANGTSSEQLLNHDFNTVANFAPSNWTISSGTWAACSGSETSSLCVGFEDTPYHQNYTTSA